MILTPLLLRKTPEDGYKFHATTKADSLPWHYEVASWNGPASELAITFTKIGQLADGLNYQTLDLYLRNIPMTVPYSDIRVNRERTFSCRVWFREAIRCLDNSNMFVKCSQTSLELLETELVTRACAAEYGGNLPKVFKTELAGAWS